MSNPSVGPLLHGDAGIRVRVIGILQGRETDDFAAVSIAGHAVVLQWERAAAWHISMDALDGIMANAGQLTLYLASGDVLEFTENDRLRGFAKQLMDVACAMPELTRGLRAMGSERGSPGPAHDRWFQPLLAARRAVAGITDADRQVALVSASGVAQNMQRTLVELADQQAPNHPAMQRALRAALMQESEETFIALERLGLAADALAGGAMDTRLTDWRRWTDALREVFIAADNSWPRCAAVLVRGL